MNYKTSDKIKVAIISDNLSCGGINRYCINLINGLHKNLNIEVQLFTFSGGNSGWLIQECKNHNIPFELIIMKGTFDLLVVRRLGKFLLERQFQIVHSQGYRSNIISRLTINYFRLPVKFLSTVHGTSAMISESFRLGLYTILDRLLMRYIDQIIAVSDKTKYQLRYCISPKKIAVVHNGVEIYEPEKAINEKYLLNDRNILFRKKTIGFVGRLSHEKGLNVLNKIVKKVLSSYMDITFLIIGDGPLYPLAEKIAAEWKNGVILTGEIQDVTPYYRIMDALILPSKREGLPMVVLEAMSYGVPVIASDVGGISEVISHGFNGFLCPYGDIDCMIHQIQNLINNQELKRKVQKEAFKTIKNKFSVDSMVMNTYKIYRKLLLN